MSPEQARGQAVDQRGDLYALGLIAYDMLAGRQRLASVTTPVTEMMQRLQHAPAPLRTKVAEVPADVEALVTKALDPDPLKRYQHASELIADINRIEHGHHVHPSAALACCLQARLIVILAIAGAWW
jgi:serine/threonine-protein kinase